MSRRPRDHRHRHASALASIRDETIRAEVAAVLATADGIGRQLPLSELDGVVEALWLVYLATDPVSADRMSERARHVLATIASDEVTTMGGRLDIYAALGEAQKRA